MRCQTSYYSTLILLFEVMKWYWVSGFSSSNQTHMPYRTYKSRIKQIKRQESGNLRFKLTVLDKTEKFKLNYMRHAKRMTLISIVKTWCRASRLFRAVKKKQFKWCCIVSAKYYSPSTLKSPFWFLTLFWPY